MLRRLAFALPAIVLLTVAFARSGAANVGITRPAHHSTASRGARPSVVENGSDLVLFHYRGNNPDAVAFTPDGSAFSQQPDGILKIAPDGTNTLIPENQRLEPREFNQNIVYSNGYLWYEVYHGIVRIRPDGSEHHFFQFTLVNDGFHYPLNLTAGADGLYFNFVRQVYPKTVFTIGRIGTNGVVTFFAAPEGDESFVAAPMVWANGHLYFEYALSEYPKSAGSLGRLESNGAITILPGSSQCFGGSRIVFSHNAIYSIGEAYDSQLNLLGTALCRVTLRGNFSTLTTPVSPANNTDLAVDAQGHLWIANLFGNGLYSYDLTTASVSGPYESAILRNIAPYVYVGPDQNVWTFTKNAYLQEFLAVYVRHVLSFEPTAVDLSSAAPAAKFITLESLFDGPWTAVSLDPAVATVSPAASQSGRFIITETNAGTTSIAVTDAFGNVFYEPVTAH